MNEFKMNLPKSFFAADYFLFDLIKKTQEDFPNKDLENLVNLSIYLQSPGAGEDWKQAFMNVLEELNINQKEPVIKYKYILLVLLEFCKLYQINYGFNFENEIHLFTEFFNLENENSEELKMLKNSIIQTATVNEENFQL